MERSPLSPPEPPERPDDGSEKPVKRKRARRLGGLIVEPEERPAAPEALPRPASLWRRFFERGKDETPPSAEPESSVPDSSAAESEAPAAETGPPVENLSEPEEQAVLSALAEARLNELEAAEPEEPEASETHQTVVDFLETVIVSGDLDEAETRVAAEYATPEPPPDRPLSAEAVPEAVPEEAAFHEPAAAAEAAAILPLPEATAETPPLESPAAAARFRPAPGFETAVPPVLPRPVSRGPERTPVKRRYVDAAVPVAVVGYLLGRRRHTKTEKKLAATQKRLEKQVTALEQRLQSREAHIRRLAAEHKQLAAVRPPRPERPAPPRPERFTSRPAAPEAYQVHGAAKPAPEHIGQVLIPPPERRERRPEAPPLRAEQLSVAAVNKRVETMNRAELLELSNKIHVDGTNLRQVYETHLVSERGLRRLVAEHENGGDLPAALHHEIVEHQIDFERDPRLRDRGHGTAAPTAGTAIMPPVEPPAAPPRDAGEASATLSVLLERAAGSHDPAAAEAAILRARAAHEAQMAGRRARQQRLVDVSMATIVLLLVTIIVLLLLFGR